MRKGRKARLDKPPVASAIRAGMADSKTMDAQALELMQTEYLYPEVADRRAPGSRSGWHAKTCVPVTDDGNKRELK